MTYGILVPQTGIESEPWAVKARSPNHWTTRKFPIGSYFRFGESWKTSMKRQHSS